jgi:Ca2+/H+ antiporter
MLGSIFSILLVILGSCFFFGGLFLQEQSFNVRDDGDMSSWRSAIARSTVPFAELQHSETNTLIVGHFQPSFMIFF